MPHVIITSNRLPVTVSKVNGKLKFETSVGGLSNGLAAYVKGAQNRWIGWPGIATDDLTKTDRARIIRELEKRNCVPVFMTKKQVDDFYNGYSNSLLWPLMHTMTMADGPQHNRWWKAYREVNELYAEKIIEYANPTTTVWVHDYQLMQVPALLRKQLPNAHIGFFLHIPFPTNRVLKKLPEAKRLVGDLLQADLVGFHTNGYVQNFIESVEKFKFGSAHGDQLVLGERTIRITEFPIGIDYDKFTGAHKLPAVKQAAAAFSKKYKGKKVIAGVDRLDITKGFAERLIAYRTFLERNPRQRGKVVFVLVGAPSRGEIDAYKRLALKVRKLVDEINTTYGNKKWQPVDYIDQAIPFEQVSALFQIANVGFIAPVRDGMNLVAKEYIASRRKNGILILSQTAGAAEELSDAILVDLKKPETLVAALEKALSMRRSEIRKRFSVMQDRVADQTIHKWSKDFMQTLQKPVPLTTRPLLTPGRKKITMSYKMAKSRVLFLDYDGILSELAQRPEDAAPTKEVTRLLKTLSADPANDIFVVSGRSRKDLGDWLGKTGVGMIAEHGAFRREPRSKTWKATSAANTSWKKELRPLLQFYADETPGAQVEEKSTALVWHYRESPPYRAQKNLTLMRKELRPLLAPLELRAHAGKKILEIKHKDTNKGVSVKQQLKTKDYEFILAIGDDYTDENMFRAVPPQAFTVKVGGGVSAARYRIKDSTAAIKLLSSLGD